jgi:hypothetical protein
MPGYGANCGGRMELVAGADWIRIGSPNYPGEFREGQECSWLLVAPPGQRVQLWEKWQNNLFNFLGNFMANLKCEYFCWVIFGMDICQNLPPSWKGIARFAAEWQKWHPNKFHSGKFGTIQSDKKV